MPVTARKRPHLPVTPITHAEVLDFRQAFEAPRETLQPANLAVELPLDQIVPSPLNPRKTFAKEELDSLAKSITSVGVQQAICVRPLPKSGHVRDRTGEPLQQYELIFGERRYRASILVGKKTIPTRIVDVTDEEALDLQARENLDRVDLNPIERAITFSQLLEHCHLTQEALASRYKVSQAEISNAVRLLTLPAEWQDYVASGVLSPTHARELLPWCDLPDVLKKLERRASGQNPAPAFPSVREWKSEINHALNQCSRSMAAPRWPGDSKGCRFRATKPADREALDIRDVPTWDGTEKRAFNVTAWEERQKAAKKRAAEKPVNEESQQTNSTQPKHDWQRQNFLRSIWHYKIQWTRLRIGSKAAELVSEGLATDSQRHLLWCLGAVLLRSPFTHLADKFVPAGSEDIQAHELAKASRADIDQRFVTGALAWLQADVSQWDVENEADGILALADAFDVKLARDWRPEQDFVELFDAEQRREFLLASTTNPKTVESEKLSTAAFLENWSKIPSVDLPDVLLHVTRHGQIQSAKPKKAKKK